MTLRLRSSSPSRLITWTFCFLFSNAEVFEDDVQDLLCPDPAGDPAQAGESQADPLRRQSEVRVSVPLVLTQSRHALLQVGPVASLGEGGGTRQGVTTPTEGIKRSRATKHLLHIITNILFK